MKLASIQSGLERALPESFFNDVTTFNSEQERIEKLESFDALLPFVSWDLCASAPGIVSVYLICKYTANKVFSFMSHIVRYTLVPGKCLEMSAEQAMEFSIGDVPYVFREISLHIDFQKDLARVRRNLPFAAAEIRRGITNPHAARAMLERREFFDATKVEFVYDDLHFLCKRRPELFDVRIFSMFESIFARTNSTFRALRRTRHFSRIIAAFFYLDHLISVGGKGELSRRQVHIHTFPAKLRFPFGERSVMGIAVAVSALESGEFLTITQLMAAVTALLPGSRLVKNSEIEFAPSLYAGALHYFEIENIEGSPITPAQRQTLRELLPSEIKGHIERLIHPIFMPRNDEEIYRNVVRLSSALTSETTPPQITINYEHQIDGYLVFSAVCVRLIRLDAPPLSEVFEGCAHRLFFDQVKVVGKLSEELVKEANIFRIHVAKHKFMRKDGSIDIYKTQIALLSDLGRFMPNLTDFHHDLIEELREELSDLKGAVGDIGKNEEHLLEALFYSMSPSPKEGAITTAAFVGLFGLLLEAAQGRQGRRVADDLWSGECDVCSSVVIRQKEISCREEIASCLATLDIPSNEYAIAEVASNSATYLCYVCCHKERKTFSEAIRQGFESWQTKSRDIQTLHLVMTGASPFLPDPKVGYDHESGIVMNLLFNGLMAMNHEDGVTHALAEKVEISKDRKRYRFRLRECTWSNGKPLIAYDFEYSWKRMIDPHFSTVYAYLFFIVKNAKLAHEKLANLDDVGIFAEDERHLVVELEEPSPYFLELTAQWPFFPVSSSSLSTTTWSSSIPREPHVSCGPFKLSHFKHSKELHLVKNPSYWDSASVKLERVCITTADSLKAQLQMFDNDEVDWVNFSRLPLPPEIQQIYEKSDPSALITRSASSTFSLFLNTECFPFNNAKLRRAFGLAIDRAAIVEKAYKGKGEVTTSILPPAVALQNKPYFKDHDIKTAQTLFAEGLKDLGVGREQLPQIVITHLKSPLRHSIVENIRQQWEHAFGIRVSFEELDWDAYFHKITYEEYHVCGLTWHACYHDPGELLDCFKYKSNKVNYSNWEHPDYIRLIEAASKEYSIEARQRALLKVEELFIDQMPAIPLCSSINTYLQKPRLKGVQISSLGIVNFKYAYIKET